LTKRIQDHKLVLVNIVKPKICTERARHYTEAYRLHIDKPVPVRRALALALHFEEKEIWIKNEELIVGNQASDLRATPIFPEYTVTWIEQEIDDLASRPGAGFAIGEEDKRIIHEVSPSGMV
jgi:formate C-acetyltransferase